VSERGTGEHVASMRREKSEWGPMRKRVPMRGEGADGPVVAMKFGNAVGAKGPNFLADDVGQPAVEGVSVGRKALCDSEVT
jgi:hypothetical protein